MGEKSSEKSGEGHDERLSTEELAIRTLFDWLEKHAREEKLTREIPENYEVKREQELKNAIEYEKKEHPVTDFDFDPDAYKTEKTPEDIMHEGKCLAYYDTQSAFWRLGDRSNPSIEDRVFESYDEVEKYLGLYLKYYKPSVGFDIQEFIKDMKELDETNVDNNKKNDAQADAA